MVKKSKKIEEIEKFKRDTKGMTESQKFEYYGLSESEKTKYLASIKPKEDRNINQTDNKTIDKLIKYGTSVIVLNMRGKPLMPTSPGKARILLKKGKAKVIKRDPFTIQLKYATGENRQPIKLKIDPGYKNVGFSATTEKRELISGEVILRTDIPERLLERKMYRKGRRNRNTRYREPRWKNRGIPKGWLAPSIQHKLDTYSNLVNKFVNMLPITSIHIEISPFDTQKMMNSEISGIEYQQGTLQGYEVKEYLLEKFGRKCVYGGETNVPLETEHIIPISRGGTNRISNLTIACHECNQKKGNMTAAEFGFPDIQLQAKQTLKAAAFMNIVRSRLVDNIKKECPDLYVESTYGYITKYNRIKQGLEKTHANDAFVIAGDKNQIRSRPYHVKQIRRNDRSLQLNRKGHEPSIKKQRYKFKPGDLIKRLSLLSTTGWGIKREKKDRSKVFTVKGVFNLGEWIRLENPILGEKDISIKIDDAKIYKYGSGLLFQLENRKEVKKKDKINKLTKKEKEILSMQGQRSIDNAWE